MASNTSYSSSDEDIEYGRKTALPVADFDDYDPSIPPVSGEEYLRRVQLEAAKCPKVVVADSLVGRDYICREDGNVDGEQFVKSKNPLSLDLQQEMILEFTRIRTKLEELKETLTIEEKRKARSHHPGLNNVLYYKKWCLGSEASSDSSDEDMAPTSSSKSKGQKYPPVKVRNLPLKFLLSMDQEEILFLLSMQAKWIDSYGFDQETNGPWVYSLLSALEKPLGSNAYSTLRQVSRCVSQCRSLFESSQENDEDAATIRSMDLVICIIGRYFDQQDLLD